MMNMPAYKDNKTGTWFVKFYFKDWTGENKQIKKRGFATKREALDYERNYKIRQENNLDMTFGEFWKLYKVEWIAERLSACGAYEEINVAVKADIFRLNIADVSGSIRLFSDVMKRLGIRLAGDEIYEEFQKIYNKSVSMDADKGKVEDRMWNIGRGR